MTARTRRGVCVVCNARGPAYLCTAHRTQAASQERRLAAGRPLGTTRPSPFLPTPLHSEALRLVGFPLLSDHLRSGPPPLPALPAPRGQTMRDRAALLTSLIERGGWVTTQVLLEGVRGRKMRIRRLTDLRWLHSQDRLDKRVTVGRFQTRTGGHRVAEYRAVHTWTGEVL